MTANTTDRADDSEDGRRDTPTDGASRATGVLTRRRYVQALGATVAGAAASGAGVGTAAAQSGGFDSFVDTDGTEFVDANGSLYFNGTNNFWLTDASTVRADPAGHRDRVDQTLDTFADMGINVIRMWANGVGQDGSGVDQLQPSPGQYDDTLLRMHDYVVAAAGERNIRVIPSMVDNWDWEGGMLQYAEWTGGSSREHFYTDPEARQLYRDHVETLATRENYHTGVEWREDPTIAMWELANEPRFEADDTVDDRDTWELRQAGEHRETLASWFEEMSQHVKELDPNHLVSTGSEGHFYREGEEYPDGTWDGQDFVYHHSIDTIDAASFHWYPDHWWCHDGCNDLSQVPLDRGSDWIENHVQAAHDELGKPAYLGEFNVRAERPDQNQSDLPQGDGHDLSTREQYLDQYYEAADQSDLNAAVVWQVVQESTQDHDGFQIYPSDDSAAHIETFGDVVAEKSGDGTTGNPCQEAGAVDGEQVDGQWVCDVSDDGWHRDVNADGEVAQDDVVHFFENQHRDAWKRDDLFDFSGSGSVGHGDVVALFEYVSL